MVETEPAKLFEKRKQDHLRIAMDPRSQADGFAGFDFVSLVPEALPDLDFSEIKIQTNLLGHLVSSPFFISSMTAGHENGELINSRLATFAQERNILMGVGSQRRELTDSSAISEWSRIRKIAPQVKLIGNLGIAQLIQTPIEQVQKLVDNLQAVAIFIHLNPLQECIQSEGTPQFKGGLKAIEKLCANLSVPVVVKEVGCGLSAATIEKLIGAGVRTIDVSGKGGTHWGRIEGLRAQDGSAQRKAGAVFENWGLATVQSLATAIAVLSTTKQQVTLSQANQNGANLKTSLWASGGVRSGLDAAKLLAMGADAVGMAKPFLEAALISDQALTTCLDQFEYELKIAMFCTGSENLQALKAKKVWTWT